MTPEDYERFMSRTAVDAGGCLVWTGGVHKPKGYPVFTPKGGKYGLYCRRLLWEHQHDGQVPEKIVNTCGKMLWLSHLAPAHQCDPDYRQQQREMRKRIILGQGGFVDARPAVAHTRRLFYRHGMSAQRIADLADVNSGTVRYVIRHEKKRLRMQISQRLLSVKPEPLGPDQRGRLVDITPTRRRVHAWMADGFPARFIADQCDLARDAVQELSHGPRKTLWAATAVAVADAFDKFDGVTPEEMMIPERTVGRMKALAARKNYAPRHCWDADTIDDPNAIPEWTGRCGTAEGYDIHRREGHTFYVRHSPTYVTTVQGCPPCCEARAEANRRRKANPERQPRSKLTADDHDLIRERRANGESAVSIAESYGVTTVTVHRVLRLTTRYIEEAS